MTLELEELSFLESFDWICFSYNSCAKNVSDWYKKKKKNIGLFGENQVEIYIFSERK